MPRYTTAFHDTGRLPGSDAVALTVKLFRDEEYLCLCTTTVDGRALWQHSAEGADAERRFWLAWAEMTTEVVEDAVRHGEVPRDWDGTVRTVELDGAAVARRAEAALARGDIELRSFTDVSAGFDCFTPDNNRWEFRSGRGKKRWTVDLRVGVERLSRQVRRAHAAPYGYAHGPVVPTTTSASTSGAATHLVPGGDTVSLV